MDTFELDDLAYEDQYLYVDLLSYLYVCLTGVS